jgi:hypothetical protein
MKTLIFVFCIVFFLSNLNAQKAVWQPSPGHMQIPIWPGAAPDARPVAPGSHGDNGQGLAGCRQAVGFGERRLAADDDDLSAQG